MERVALLDTGPLVSFLADGLTDHVWAVEQWKQVRPALLTFGRSHVRFLTEAAFLLKGENRDTDALFALLERGIIRIGLAVDKQQADLRALVRRYRNRPMSLADACLVRLSEILGSLPRLLGPALKNDGGDLQLCRILGTFRLAEVLKIY